jgi:cellulose synthase/poly-beta-1,6-N-acetylglucosamine synthase-like glycosyltransferase
MQPFISIIVPCRNEAVSLARCLQSILASSYAPDRMEVIVADGMSDDGSRALLDRFASSDARLRVIDNRARITPSALNRAIEASKGDLILRIDAHSVIEPTYIATLVDFLTQNPEAWGAGGRMHTQPESQGPFSESISIVLRHRFGVGNSDFRTLANSATPQKVDTVFNCCWRREVFRRVGLFHEQLVRSQDIEMSNRIASAGGTLWLVPQAETTYFARTSFVPYVRHNWANGIWSLVPAIYLGHLPVSWRHLVPLTFVASLLFTTAIALAVPALKWLPILPALPYALANILASCKAASSPRQALLLPITFAALHLAYGAGSLWGAIQIAVNAIHPQTSTTPAPILNSEF